MAPVAIDIPQTLDRLCYRYPSMLVDAIIEHETGRRLVAVKNVTVNEEFFQGHFPGTPLMPAVLMIESFVQVAAILIVAQDAASARTRVYLRGVNDARFRRQVVPGDRLRLEVSLGRRRGAARPRAGVGVRRRSGRRRVRAAARAGGRWRRDPPDGHRAIRPPKWATARPSARTPSSARTSGSGRTAR